MANFFSNTHEAFPVEIAPEPDLDFCAGSIDNISFSGLMKAESCMYNLFLSKVKGIGSVGGPAADRGSQLHNMLEEYVNGTTEQAAWGILKSKAYYVDLVEGFRKDYQNDLCIPEWKYAITKDITPTKWDAKDMWHRGAIDVVIFETSEQIRAAIYDYKSGRNTASVKHRSQLMLYAMMLFLFYPTLQEIRAAPVYIDHAAPIFYTSFQRKDYDVFWPRFRQRFLTVTDATHFPPTPSAYACQWCQHKKAQESLGQVEPACEFAFV